MAVAPSVPMLALAYLVVQVANNAANAPWSAIIADQVPPGQRGAASGWNGLFSVLGTVVGALVGGLIVNKDRPLDEYRVQLLVMYGLIAVVQAVVVLLTVWRVRETPITTARPFGRADILRTYWVSPSAGRDFFWVCLTRFLVQQGIFGVFFFLQYYFDDVLGLPGERTMGTQFLPLVMLAAMTTVYFAGSLSDRYGRKPLVYLSGAMMSIVCFAFIFFQVPAAVPIVALCFGIGYGAYTSVDWALACDVLPDDQEYGRDMGIWAIAGILPQIFGIVLGGVTLAFFKSFPNNLGYTMLFVFTLFWFLLGTVLIAQVKQVR
jgi:MFS family permease